MIKNVFDAHRTNVLKVNTVNFILNVYLINFIKEYDEMYELNSHMDDKHDVKQISCNDCNQIFSNLSEIRHHVKEHIDKTCPRCQKTYAAL